MKLVYIEWHDAYSHDPWGEIDDVAEGIESPCVCMTVGWLLKEDDDCYIICHTTNTDNQVTGSLHIPKPVKQFKVLRQSKG